MTGFIEQFGTITDPRVDRIKKHKLIDILFIILNLGKNPRLQAKTLVILFYAKL